VGKREKACIPVIFYQRQMNVSLLKTFTLAHQKDASGQKQGYFFTETICPLKISHPTLVYG